MLRLRNIRGIRNAYSRRILSNVMGKDPVATLAATAARLRRLTTGLSPSQMRQSPAKGKWSIAQLVCHLSDSEVVLAFRLRMAIAQSGSPLQAMDEKKWAAGLGYLKANVKEKIEVFEKLRRDHVRLLRSLSPSERKRYGMHEERGRESVERMAQMYAGHDINHIRQIESIRNMLLRDRSR